MMSPYLENNDESFLKGLLSKQRTRDLQSPKDWITSIKEESKNKEELINLRESQIQQAQIILKQLSNDKNIIEKLNIDIKELKLELANLKTEKKTLLNHLSSALKLLNDLQETLKLNKDYLDSNQNLKIELKNKIINSLDVSYVINSLLNKYSLSGNNKKMNELILLNFQHNKLVQDNNLGLITRDEYYSKLNRIILTLLEQIDTLDQV